MLKTFQILTTVVVSPTILGLTVMNVTMTMNRMVEKLMMATAPRGHGLNMSAIVVGIEEQHFLQHLCEGSHGSYVI